MESPDFSLLSSLRGEFKHEDYIPPHYKESYRLAIDCLVKSGRDSYRDFLKGERVGSFLSEEELLFITENAQQPPPPSLEEEVTCPLDSQSSSGTYWPMHSDSAAPDLDLGWPEVMHDQLQTNIDVLFHPARQNSVTIKEVVRKKIQEARQVIKTYSARPGNFLLLFHCCFIMTFCCTSLAPLSLPGNVPVIRSVKVKSWLCNLGILPALH